MRKVDPLYVWWKVRRGGRAMSGRDRAKFNPLTNHGTEFDQSRDAPNGPLLTTQPLSSTTKNTKFAQPPSDDL